MSDGVAHLHLARCLDARNNVAHVACTQHFARFAVEPKDAHLVGVILLASVHKLHKIACGNLAVHNLEIGDDAAERVENRIENQRLKRCLRVAFWRRNHLHNALQNLIHALARLAAGRQNVVAVAADKVHNLVLHLFRHSVRKVDFIDDGDYLKIMLDGQIQVRNCLSLNALCGVDNEQRTLAGGY